MGGINKLRSDIASYGYIFFIFNTLTPAELFSRVQMLAYFILFLTSLRKDYQYLFKICYTVCDGQLELLRNREKKNKSSNIIVCFSLITVQGQGRRYQKEVLTTRKSNLKKMKKFSLDGALGQCSVFISSDNLN